MCDGLNLSADHPDYLILFRRHVSRSAYGKGRAVLERLQLDAPTIRACVAAHPLNEEEAVQVGLTRWCEGKGTQPATWRVLIEAMQYVGIGVQHILNLIDSLALLGMLLYVCMLVYGVMTGVSAVQCLSHV